MVIAETSETLVEIGGGGDETSTLSVSFSPFSTSSLIVSESVVRLQGLSALSLFFFNMPKSLSLMSFSSSFPKIKSDKNTLSVVNT